MFVYHNIGITIDINHFLPKVSASNQFLKSGSGALPLVTYVIINMYSPG